MKQNLMIVCFDYLLSKRVSKKLAEVFSMRTFDELELFEFDNIPLSFDEIKEKFGYAYIEKNLRSIVKMETEFKDAIFVADIGFAKYAKEFLEEVFENNFVILLKKKIDCEIKELNKREFASDSEKEFFTPAKQDLENYENQIENKAEITLFVDGLDDDAITEKIVDEIQEKYSV